MSCIKEQQGGAVALKMGAKRVSDTIRLEKLLWKGRESNGTSVAANDLFNSFGPFSVHKLSVERLFFFFPEFAY